MKKGLKFEPFSIYLETISFPKGLNEMAANLKCCFANGMPTIVMASTSPKITCVNVIQIPPIKNQIMFMTSEIKPLLFSFSLIVELKGSNVIIPIFKV